MKVKVREDQVIVLAKPHTEEKVEETPKAIEDIELSERKARKQRRAKRNSSAAG